MLFPAVPIPNIKEPDTLAAPLAGTLGSVRTTPLLSTGSSVTGFCTCPPNGTAVPVQIAATHEKYSPVLLLFAHVGPQSCMKRPIPRMPLNKTTCGSESTGWPHGLLATVCPAKVGLITCTGTRTRGSPPSPTSATCTGPQVAPPSAKAAHVPRGFPWPSTSC